jgi:glutaredoxin-like YruB-family protein
MGKSVKVYSTPACPWCRVAKQFLSDHGIAFEEVDVAEDQEQARAMVEKSGQMGVPVIEVGKEIIVGFDEARLRKVLGIRS